MVGKRKDKDYGSDWNDDFDDFFGEWGFDFDRFEDQKKSRAGFSHIITP